MKKARIREYTSVDGSKSYTIQQRHFLFFWWWVPAWVNSSMGASAPTDTFKTLEEAQANIKYFDGSKGTERIINC